MSKTSAAHQHIALCMARDHLRHALQLLRTVAPKRWPEHVIQEIGTVAADDHAAIKVMRTEIDTLYDLSGSQLGIAVEEVDVSEPGPIRLADPDLLRIANQGDAIGSRRHGLMAV